MIKKYSARLKSIIATRYFKILIFLLVFLFTFILRAHNYDRVPTPNHLDEMLYAWSGIYLVETGIPVSWSTLDYPKRAEVFKGEINYHGGFPKASVTLYKPWLDEPPLFSLLVGYFAHINHADRTQFIPSSYIRIPVVLIAAFCSLLIFAIAKMVSGFWTAILAMLVYGTTPLIVFASRTAMPENVIAFLLMLLLFLVLQFFKNPRWYYLLPVPFLIGLAGLSKPTGFLLLPLALYLFFIGFYKIKKTKHALISVIYLILSSAIFIAIYFWYGLSQDAQIFWRINAIQSHRPVGFGSLAWFFITPSYDTALMRDSFYIFLSLAAAYFIFSTKFVLGKLNEKSSQIQIVILTFIYWVMVVMISGGENDLLAWYRFGALPTLAIIGAWGLQYIVRKADLFASFLGVGMLLGNRMLLVNAFRPNIDPNFYRIIFGVLMLPSVLATIFNQTIWQKVTKVILVSVIVVGTYFNIIYIYNAFEISCESIRCPIVPSTPLSSLYFPVIWKFLVLGEPALH